ncbi:MAG: DUF4476 domain-containing protein [Bacteroidetes bacterium]|nr:DUF4476 domain-containing protein [Bacteroidota bacterium]
MKKLSFFIALALLSLSLNAQFSELQLSAYNNAPFDLILDGQKLASNVSQLKLGALNPGTHSIQIVESNLPNMHGFAHNPYKLLFSGQINIAPNRIVQAVVYPNQLQILNELAYQAPVNFPNNSYNGAYDNVYYDYQSNQNTYYYNNYSGNSYSNNTCAYQANSSVFYGPQAMDEVNFNLLKNSIDKQWFSSGQMQVFEQAARTNYFTSAQVRELISLFDFSNDQLQVAKLAYTRTVDPQNYFVVNDVLTYSSSVASLNAYIASL